MACHKAFFLSLALALGCGKSKEEDLFNKRKDVCAALSAGTITLAQATHDFSSEPYGASCPPDGESLAPLPNDHCDYAAGQICLVRWEWLAGDQSLCSAFGCIYGCEARVPGGAAALTNPETVICATRFYDGQPF
jgi:hypothetical protein